MLIDFNCPSHRSNPHLLKAMHVLLELLRVREGDGIHSLKALTLSISPPIRSIACSHSNSLERNDKPIYQYNIMYGTYLYDHTFTL